MCGIVVNRVEDESPRFPEGIAVEKNVWHGPGCIAVGAGGVIPCGRTERRGIVCVESVMCRELEGRTLE
jgi:hypothetical protein